MDMYAMFLWTLLGPLLSEEMLNQCNSIFLLRRYGIGAEYCDIALLNYVIRTMRAAWVKEKTGNRLQRGARGTELLLAHIPATKGRKR